MNKILFIILFVTLSAHAAQDKKSLEAYLDQHFTKIVIGDLSTVANGIKHGVRIRTSVNQQLLASHESAPVKDEMIRLPLGGSLILASELRKDSSAPLESNSFDHPDTYRSLISNVDVQVDWGEDLTPNIELWLKDKIIASLRLDELPSFKVKILPIPIFREQKPEPVKVNWLGKRFELFKDMSSEESAAVIVTSMMMLAGLVYLIFNLLSQGTQSWALRKTISEAVTRLSNTFGQSSGPVTTAATSTTTAPVEVKAVEHDPRWDNVKIPELIAFSYDGLEHPLYESSAIVLVHHLLPLGIGQELRASLPDYFFDVDGPGRFVAPATEVSEAFFSKRMEYVLLASKPLVQALLPHSTQRCVQIIRDLQKSQRALEAMALLNRLTPFKRFMAIEQLTLEERLNMASVAKKRLDPTALNDAENALANMLKKTPSNLQAEHISVFPLEWMGQELLKAQSFTEDEELHVTLKNLNVVSLSPLAALDLWDDNHWQSLALNEVAMLFFGYSEVVRSAVKAKYDSKRQEWFDNFVLKYKQSFEWNSPEVMAIRKKWAELLSMDQNAGDEDNKENETISQISRAA